MSKKSKCIVTLLLSHANIIEGKISATGQPVLRGHFRRGHCSLGFVSRLQLVHEGGGYGDGVTVRASLPSPARTADDVVSSTLFHLTSQNNRDVLKRHVSDIPWHVRARACRHRSPVYGQKAGRCSYFWSIRICTKNIV